jgi:uncharacterized protein YcfJ
MSKTTGSSKSQLVYHHLLVVEAVDESHIKVIHKEKKGVVEEKINKYSPEDITVLVYKSKYTGEDAITRARSKSKESYNLLTRNCEHFVTEARTGVKQSSQIEGSVKGGVSGAVVGAAAGIALGVIVKAGTVGFVCGGFIGALIGVAGGVVIGIYIYGTPRMHQKGD